MSTDKNDDLGNGIPNVGMGSVSSELKNGKETETGSLDRTDLNEGVISSDLNQRVGSNELILDCIFGFSDFEDIKQFRQVCRLWKKVALPFMKKVSLVSFSMPDFSFQRFNEVFENSELDFTAVKLTDQKYYLGMVQWQWNSQDLTQLLENRRSSMRELTISRIKVNQALNLFDISPYIEPSLTKLELHLGYTHFKMIISLDRCTFTKFLSLENCCLKIANGIKINPVELTLKDVQVIENGTLSLNKFVNFDRLKRLSLDVHTDRTRNLSLHFKDPITVEKLSLFGNLNLDFENAKWKVTEKLTISIEFATRNGMEFSNLEFEGALLDVAVLPTNLRRLLISSMGSTVIFSKPINLPELDFVHLITTDTSDFGDGDMQIGIPTMSYISQFQNCENLTTIMLTFYKSQFLLTNSSLKVDIGTFPQSVRNLYVSGKIEFVGQSDGILLKQLHLQKGDLSTLNSILPKCIGEDLAIDLRDFDGVTSVYSTVTEILERPFQRIALALNHQEDVQKSGFITSPLYNCVDKISEFYLFVNKFGKAISKAQFEELFTKEEKVNEN